MIHSKYMRRIQTVLLSLVLLAIPSFSFADVSAQPDSDTPVLFLPGLQASRLYVFFEDGSFERVWEPLSNNDLEHLEMTSQGESVNDIRVGQVIDKIFGRETIYGENVLDSTNQVFVDTAPDTPLRLEDALSPEIRNYKSTYSFWTAYPYDWRYDVFDIIEDGTLRTDGSRQYLIDVVEKLAENTGSINIVAHSNGGLLAKALMVKLTELGKEDLVEKIILVGSPQLGTPEAVGSLLHGYGQNLLMGFITSSSVAREVSRNFPGAYSLLPSPTYFDVTDTPVVTSSVTQGIVTNIPDSPITTHDDLRKFLVGETFVREEPEPHFIEEPIILNGSLIDKAVATHEEIEGVEIEGKLYEIVGTGNQTVSGFNYKNFLALRCPEHRLICHTERTIKYSPVLTKNGDGTVLKNSAGLSSEQLFLDLKEENRGALFGGTSHKNLLSNESIVRDINTLLFDENGNLNLLSEDPSLEAEDLISISAHSPVILSAEDTDGNVTSIEYDSDPGVDLLRVREEIPGSFVEFVGEGKYLFVPAGDYIVTIVGTDVGSFDLTLSEVTESGELNDIESHESIPITGAGKAVVDISDKKLSALSLDIEDDGIEDISFTVGETAEEILDYLETEFDSLNLGEKLAWAINQYFSLLESESSEELRMTYISQLDRITRYLTDREITQATADKWRAYMRHLK